MKGRFSWTRNTGNQIISAPGFKKVDDQAADTMVRLIKENNLVDLVLKQSAKELLRSAIRNQPVTASALIKEKPRIIQQYQLKFNDFVGPIEGHDLYDTKTGMWYRVEYDSHGTPFLKL